MSRIIFQDTYTIVIPSFNEVEAHSHSMLHLFMGSEACEVVINQMPVSGNAIFVKANTEHVLRKENACKLFFLFDPTSSYAQKVKELYLKENNFCIIDFESKTFINDIGEKTNEEILAFSKLTLERIFGNSCDVLQKDERILELVERIKSGKCFHKSISEIADEAYISESRLQHLFKETMGITLKNYILMKQIEYCYKLVLSGKNITYAAMEAGFSSAAHLAYTCKKSMGISISNVFKNSSFLKA